MERKLWMRVKRKDCIVKGRIILYNICTAAVEVEGGVSHCLVCVLTSPHRPTIHSTQINSDIVLMSALGKLEKESTIVKARADQLTSYTGLSPDKLH